jgi:signal transduction histidine kinase/ligand-binding sensor domain-containing protein
LPQSTVTAVVQTRDGYLWAATYSGLARFDGVRFTVFDGSNTPEMRSSRVTSLFEADDGTLWIGHEGGEVTCCRNGRFEAVAVKARWTSTKISDIGADAAGDVWLMNEEGLLARLRDGLVLSPEQGPLARVVGMARSRDGSIWVARDGQVSHLEGERLTVLRFNAQTTNSYVQGIGVSRDGGLWVASDGQLREWKDQRWTQDLGPAPWGVAALLKLLETGKGVLAAATSSSGLYLVAAGQRPLQFSRTNGFVSDWVVSLCEDREGSLWAGTGGGGLVVVRGTAVRTVTPPDRWQGRPVLCVSPGRDGALWIGTEGAGLYHLRDGQWERFGEPAGIQNSYVWSVAESEGGLWVGTWGGGLFQRQGAGFALAPGLERITSPMPALLCARGGGLWIGSGDGLLRYQAGKSAWAGTRGASGLRDVRALAEESDGTLWFGMSGLGLGCLKHEELRWFRKADGLASDFVECLHLDRDGGLWIGTFGGGLNRFKQGRFATIGQSQGLPSNVICHIEEDGQGFFWMSSHSGLIRASKAELDSCADGHAQEIHWLTYGLSDGLPTLKCSGGLQPAGCRTPDGRLWFPTGKGLVSVDPQNVRTNPWPPPVVIERFLLDDRVAAEAKDLHSPLEIPPGRHRLEFQYTGLSFVAPEKVSFKHRLEGLESSWVNAGSRRTAQYNYILPGRYTFHVIACNNDQVWNDEGATLAFTILPYFWQTWWFRGLAGMAVVVAASGLVWFDTRRRMRRKLEALERQRAVEHERARIARDIHDDLGSHLTRITMLSESARGDLDNPAAAGPDIDRIYDTARALTRAMDEIVWAVNPRFDSLESLTNYLEKLAQDFLATAGLRCRLDMPGQFPQWPLTSEVRHNLFLAFKEALNNVVKHAAASEVRISLSVAPAGFELVVADNGRGFDPTSPAPVAGSDRFAPGNGLENMRRRLAEAGGRCDIRSAAGQGTTIVFTVPVRVPVA